MKFYISISDFFNMNLKDDGIVFKEDLSNVLHHFSKNNEDVFFINSDEKIIEFCKIIMKDLKYYEDNFTYGKLSIKEFEEKYEKFEDLKNVEVSDFTFMKKLEIVFFAIRGFYVFKDALNIRDLKEYLLIYQKEKKIHPYKNFEYPKVFSFLKANILIAFAMDSNEIFKNEKINKWALGKNLSNSGNKLLNSCFFSLKDKYIIKHVLNESVYPFNKIEIDNIFKLIEGEEIIDVMFRRILKLLGMNVNIEEYKNNYKETMRNIEYIGDKIKNNEMYIVEQKLNGFNFEKIKGNNYSLPLVLSFISVKNSTFTLFKLDENDEVKEDIVFSMLTMSTKDGKKMMDKKELSIMIKNIENEAANSLKMICA